MVLSFIAGIGSKILSSGKTDDKSIDASKKKIKTEKFFDKKDKGAALVKTDATKIKIKPSSALVKYQPPEKPKDKISDLSSADKKKSTGDELQSIIDEVKKLRSGLVRVRGLLAERKNSDLKSLVESRKVLQIEKKKRREDELERKKPEENKGGISLPKPKLSFFDSIINFFTSILIGSLLNFLLANKNTIFNAFNSISKGFNNIFNVMRYAIISISTTMPKLIKSLASFGAKVFKGSAKLTGNLLKKLGGTIKNLLVRTGKALGSFVSGTFKNLRGLAGGAGASATRGTGVQQRRLTGAGGAKPGARPRLRQLPKPGVPKPTSPATLTNAERLFTKGGFKHFKKVSGIFKKVPFIGALIGIGIDLAMGERLDNAIAGAAGASLGAAIGGAIGTAVLPIPFVGTFLGGTVGAAVGDWAGKEIYKKLSGQITQINPPVESGFSDKLQRRLNSPLPPDVPSSSGGGGGGASVGTLEQKAMLDAIAFAEGTKDQPNGGYKTLFGFGQFDDYSKHPDKVVRSGRYASAAAGRYQFMPDTFNRLAKKLGLKDFSPASQDKAAIELARELGITENILRNGGISPRVSALLGRQWASFPGKTIGLDQPTKKLNSIQTVYKKSLGNPPQAPVLPGPDGKMPAQMGTKTGLVTGYGGGTPFHIDTRWARDLPMNVVVPMIDSMAAALAADGRVIETGSAGSVSGGRYPFNGTFEEKRKFLQSATAGHHTQRSMAAFDYFIPKANETRFGKSAEYANIPAPALPAGYKMSFHKGDPQLGGAFYQITDPNGRVVFKSLHGDPSKSRLGLVGQTTPNTLAAAQSLRRQASYDQRGGTIVVPAPIISGGGGQTMPSGGSGGVLPVGMLQKDVLNSYYRAQLLGFLYKQG